MSLVIVAEEMITLGSGDLTSHYERFLGAIDAGWRADADGRSVPFQVARYSGVIAGGTAFTTLGLSGWELKSRSSEKTIRLELMMLVGSTLQSNTIPGLLQQVGLETIESNSALLRGDVIGPRGKLFAGSNMDALYVAAPVYLPDEFAICETEAGPTVTCWVVPISHDEAHFVIQEGWSRFEDRLVELNPDLVDVMRPSLFSS
ncbi:suppressor of fused domain protein [Fodinicola feengrottensis]|uniref:Suppressor of fused domain protein n=1 Tax=Fodinicola feengrottensis TaxID=435914 RepID=A0ABP4RVR5_9ACTN